MLTKVNAAQHHGGVKHRIGSPTLRVAPCPTCCSCLTAQVCVWIIRIPDYRHLVDDLRACNNPVYYLLFFVSLRPRLLALGFSTMMLLNATSLQLHEFFGYSIPIYAILSHTWEEDEVTLQDIVNSSYALKRGFAKVHACCAQALRDGFTWV